MAGFFDGMSMHGNADLGNIRDRHPLKEHLERTLGAVDKPSRGLKAVLAFAVLAVVIFAAAIYSSSPNLSHVDVVFLSGSESGNYYAVVSRLAAEAKRQRGRIENRLDRPDPSRTWRSWPQPSRRATSSSRWSRTGCRGRRATRSS